MKIRDNCEHLGNMTGDEIILQAHFVEKNGNC